MTMKKSSLIGKTVEVIKVADVSVGDYAVGDKGVVLKEVSCGHWVDVKFEDGKCHTCFMEEVQVVNEGSSKENTTESGGKITPKIGDRVKGFKFDGYKFTVRYPRDMDNLVGKDGKVVHVGDDYFQVRFFESGGYWNYPLELAHLAYEGIEQQTQESTTMEQEDTGKDERIQAWYTVFGTLKEVMPNFTNLADTEEQCTVEAIKILAEAAKAPDIRSLKTDIEEIRQSKKKLQQQMQELDEKEAALIVKLKEHGFVLVEAGENKTVLYAEDSDEDMTNPENWKVGDKLEVLVNEDEHGEAGLSIGELVTKVRSCSMYDDRISVSTKSGWTKHLKPKCFKFHSRPKK